MKHKDITSDIIKSFYKVYNNLGYGFLEKVYENALCLELKKMNYLVENQKSIQVFYDGEVVGNYFADLLINNKVIVVKAASSLCEAHKVQLINYLKATDKEVGLLLNFGVKAEFKRVISSNSV